MVFRPVADDLVHHRHDEKTVGAFVDGMRERALPLHVFHFDCFWMRVQHWCDFEWNRRHSAIPRACWPGLKAKGLRTWVWINPYIADRGYSTKAWPRAICAASRQPGLAVGQWQSGMSFVDFINPKACAWYAGHPERLVAMSADCFKADFGERIPTDSSISTGPILRRCTTITHSSATVSSFKRGSGSVAMRSQLSSLAQFTDCELSFTGPQ